MKKGIGFAVAIIAAMLFFAPKNVYASEEDALAQQLLQQQLLQQLLEQQLANPQLYVQPAPPLPAPTPVPTPVPAPAPSADPAAGEQQTPALSTYVDVSIDTQTLVYYENGTPVLISPVVTGSPGRSTPRGVFMINSCVPGKYLTGPTWHVWVNRWMRFSGNCGLHDASWRSSFGGDIYKRNGSHGCVNLPTDVATALYDRVGIGTVVIVH